MRSSSGRNSSGRHRSGTSGGSRGGNSGGRGGSSGGRGGSGGGRGNFRGAGNDRDDKQGGRPKNPRPEERRYDVGPGGTHEGPKSGRGASARGGAKGGPKQGQSTGRGRSVPATSREYEARAEERNRERYA